MEEVKSCPFCGGEGHMEREGKGWGDFWISCTECGATVDGETEDEVKNKWNKRICDSSL